MVEAVEDLQQRLHDTFGTPPGRRARTGSIRCGFGEDNRGETAWCCRAMMRAIAPLGTAGAAG